MNIENFVHLIQGPGIFLYWCSCPCLLSRGVCLIKVVLVWLMWDSFQDIGNCPLNGELLNTGFTVLYIGSLKAWFLYDPCDQWGYFWVIQMISALVAIVTIICKPGFITFQKMGSTSNIWTQNRKLIQKQWEIVTFVWTRYVL